MKNETVNILDDLLTHDEIKACMVMHQNMNTIMPTKSEYEPEVNNLIERFEHVKDTVFKVIAEYAKVGLYKSEYRFRDHEVWFYLNPKKPDYALVAIFPLLANKGIISVELEKSWQKVKKVYGEKPVIS